MSFSLHFCLTLIFISWWDSDLEWVQSPKQDFFKDLSTPIPPVFIPCGAHTPHKGNATHREPSNNTSIWANGKYLGTVCCSPPARIPPTLTAPTWVSLSRTYQDLPTPDAKVLRTPDKRQWELQLPKFLSSSIRCCKKIDLCVGRKRGIRGQITAVGHLPAMCSPDSVPSTVKEEKGKKEAGKEGRRRRGGCKGRKSLTRHFKSPTFYCLENRLWTQWPTLSSGTVCVKLLCLKAKEEF